MSDSISREEVLDEINRIGVRAFKDYASYSNFFDFVSDLSTEERPQGKWYYNYKNSWHCSICHESIKDMPTIMGEANFNFCPNCGADMRGNN